MSENEDSFVRTRSGPGRGDRRRFRRWRVNISVREIGPELHIYRATNLGAGGVYCPHATPRDPGETLRVEIDVGNGRPVVTDAVVVHCGHGQDGFGVALEFSPPLERLEQRLRDALGSYDWTGGAFPM